MDRYITVKTASIEGVIWNIGKTVMFKKETDRERIYAYMPIIGQAGRVAEDRESMIKGTCSAARIYDSVPAVFHGRVMFILEDSVIVKLIIEERPEEIKLFDIGAMRKAAGSAMESR